VLGELDVE